MPNLTKQTRRIPGPAGEFILGNLRTVLPDKLGFLKRHAQFYGDVFQFRLGPTRFVVVNDLQMLRAILIDAADRYVKSALTRDIFGRVMGNGLMVSEGELHRRQRRLVQPAFDPRRVSSYEAVIRRHPPSRRSRRLVLARRRCDRRGR